MPAEHLTTPGFFGKLPTAGDFVSRNLSQAFVHAWDRWVARHLAPLLSADCEDGYPPLRFALGADFFGPMTGVVMASADRAGRAFPLTLAAPVQRGFSPAAEAWLDRLEEAGIAALDGGLDADALARCLLDLPPPPNEADLAPRHGMVFWTVPRDRVDVAPDEPRAALLRLLAVPAGAA